MFAVLFGPSGVGLLSIYSGLQDMVSKAGRLVMDFSGVSGMVGLGRVVNYFKRMLGGERHGVLFVGYHQAQGSPGPRGGWAQLDGERIDNRAGIHIMAGCSAHADQNDLFAFIRGILQSPRGIRLIRGERDAREALRAEIETWAEANGDTLEVTLAA